MTARTPPRGFATSPGRRGIRWMWTAKLNGLNPQHYLADVLARIADHPARQIAELLPWHWNPTDLKRAAA